MPAAEENQRGRTRMHAQKLLSLRRADVSFRPDRQTSKSESKRVLRCCISFAACYSKLVFPRHHWPTSYTEVHLNRNKVVRSRSPSVRSFVPRGGSREGMRVHGCKWRRRQRHDGSRVHVHQGVARITHRQRRWRERRGVVRVVHGWYGHSHIGQCAGCAGQLRVEPRVVAKVPRRDRCRVGRRQRLTAASRCSRIGRRSRCDCCGHSCDGARRTNVQVRGRVGPGQRC